MTTNKTKKTQVTKFEGAFIRLPSGKYAKFPSAVKAKCGVVDTKLYDTLIESVDDLKLRKADEVREIYTSVGAKAPKKLDHRALWDLLAEKAEDRCSMFQGGKRAEARANPEGYHLLRLLSNAEVDSERSLVPQAKAVLRILTSYCSAAKTMNFSEDKVIQLMNEGQELLKTKQDPFRIFRYYRPALITLKLLKMGA